MKCITVSQPYASLIASGKKWVENRTWRTAYRGPLAIHAGRGTQYLSPREVASGAYPTGATLATAHLVACVHLPDARKYGRGLEEMTRAGICAQALLGHLYAEGPWCWVLTRIEALPKPVPARGAQGLWEWTPPC